MVSPKERYPLILRIKPIVASLFAALVIRLLAMTVRWEGPDDEKFHKENKTGMILSFWHSSIFGMLYHFRGSGIAVMMSESWDGELIAQTAARFGHKAARGSTSRGGIKAFREMLGLLKKGASVGFTPDGPRGPAYHLQEGVVHLAKRSGRPIVAASVSYDRFWRIGKRWDAFHVPKPFARALVLVDEPLILSPEDDTALKRKELEEQMQNQIRRGWAHFGRFFSLPNTSSPAEGIKTS